MKTTDFRYIHQGIHLRGITTQETHLLKPYAQYTSRNERALLILHGFSSSPAGYRLLLPQIKHYDAIVCPLLPGHGESIDAFSQNTANDWLHLAQEHCASLVSKYTHVDVLGLSLGGILACILSQNFPINHLYLLAPALKIHHLNLKLNAAYFFKQLGFAQLRNSAGNIQHPKQAELTYDRLPITAIIEILEFIKNSPWQAPTCPVDLFLGTHDKVINSNAVETLFKPLSHAKIHWLKQSAHVLPLDNDLENIIRCINNYHQSSMETNALFELQ